MKNLKMFAISLLAFLVMVSGVHAATGTHACDKPGEDRYSLDCEASLGGLGYEKVVDALTDAVTDGGTLDLYVDLKLTTDYNFAKNTTINVGENTLTLDTAGTITAKSGATLTINGKEIVVNNTTTALTVEKGATLVLNANKVTAGSIASGDALIDAAGTVSVKGTIATSGVLVGLAHNGDVTLAATEVNAENLVTSPAAVPGVGDVAGKLVIESGKYTTSKRAIEAKFGVVVTIKDGVITATGADAQVADVHDAELVINGGTLTSEQADAVRALGTTKGKLTITGGNISTTGEDHKYALRLGNVKTIYAISGGTFESKGGEKTPAIVLTSDFVETKNGVTSIISSQKGILSGGRYLYYIIDGVVNGKGATVDVANDLVAAGKTVTEDGNYKVIGSTEQQDPNTGDGTQTTPGDTNTNVPDVPKTNDNILVYASLGVVSALSVGFSAKRKENN